MLPPSNFCEYNKKISRFMFENFDTVEFSPRILHSGLHQHLFLKLSEKIEKIEENCDMQVEDKGIESIVKNFIGSIKKKRVRRARDF